MLHTNLQWHGWLARMRESGLCGGQARFYPAYRCQLSTRIEISACFACLHVLARRIRQRVGIDVATFASQLLGCVVPMHSVQFAAPLWVLEVVHKIERNVVHEPITDDLPSLAQRRTVRYAAGRSVHGEVTGGETCADGD